RASARSSSRPAGRSIDVVRCGRRAFLTWYGVSSLLRARRGGSLQAATGGRPRPSGAPLRTAVALTWLNPHVYLDTVLLLGSVANTHGDGDRWWFAAGAGAASVLWFTGLGYGARLAHRALSTQRAWQVLDVLIGLTMLAIAVGLALGG
ncbi:LysE/ArgO family amino acid transporter, partial [Nocardioides plantarum]|uniref:LysE/ArgO family amino acid transporter n=1 Tax=Nocardioides plantarum TaxID=29299 RepID=UPI00361AE108